MLKSNYEECIRLCQLCASVCNCCASACLKEKDVYEMTKCIRLNMECAIICTAAAQLMSIGCWKSLEICALCVSFCEACSAECIKHNNEHCIRCADICRLCSIECKRMAA